MLHAVLANQTNEAFRNGNGNYSAVLQSLEGVTAAQAAWKPAPTHQPWREVSGDEAAWQAAKTQLVEAHERLMAVIACIPEEALRQPPVPDLNRCGFDMLLSGISSHDAYHAGQISYLKALYTDLHSA